MPNSLALVKDSMRAEDQDSAVGAWAGFSGITSAAGPLLGGWLIETLSWRAVFFLNLPLAAAAVAIGHRCLPRDREARAGGVDVAGAVLAALSLGAMVYALIDGLAHGWGWGSGACGAIALAALAAFLVRERRARAPMLPLGLFEGRQFTAANLVTLALYFALSGAIFLIVLALQHGLGYSAFGSEPRALAGGGDPPRALAARRAAGAPHRLSLADGRRPHLFGSGDGADRARRPVRRMASPRSGRDVRASAWGSGSLSRR